MTNISSNASLPVSTAQTQQKKALDQLASGKRVNNAADDAVSVAIASRIGSDAVTLGQAAITASTGAALLATADSGLSATAGLLGQLQSLAVAAQSGILSPADSANLNAQFTSLLGQVDANASSTQFAGQSLLDGSFTATNFQLGTDAGSNVNVSLNAATTTSLGLNGLDLSTPANAAAALTAITAAIGTVAGQQADLGATSSTFSSRAELIGSSELAANESLSALLDADVGKASTQQAINDALSQANIAALAKHQKSSQHLLALLR